MRNRTLTFVGESSIRDLGFAVASFLSGVTPERAEDFKFQAVGDTGNKSLEHESRAWEALGRPDGLYRSLWFTTMPERLGNGQVRGPTGGYTGPGGWRVRILHHGFYTPHFAWAALTHELKHQRPNSIADAKQLWFVTLGMHTRGWMSAGFDKVKGQYPRSMPFGPFVRLHNATLNNATEPGPRLPLIWVPMNPNCAHKKQSQYRDQAPLVDEANAGAAETARVHGLPFLDTPALFFANDSKAGSSRRPDARSVCAASGDGLHFKQWADHLRAQLLLEYLCDRPRQRYRTEGGEGGEGGEGRVGGEAGWQTVVAVVAVSPVVVVVVAAVVALLACRVQAISAGAASVVARASAPLGAGRWPRSRPLAAAASPTFAPLLRRHSKACKSTASSR